MRSTSLLRTILLIFLIALTTNSQDCSGANSSVCISSQCPGYSIINDICSQLCTSSNYYDTPSTTCRPCSSLPQSDCVSKCPNHYFNGSTLPNSTYFTNCLLCSSKFGRYCTACTQSICSSCSPGKAVTDNKLGCRDSICNIANCVVCAGTNACSQCDTGYKYNSITVLCEAMSCSIEGCAICSDASCANCLQGYSYKNGYCTPVCDRYCSVCTAPNYCQVCNLEYVYDAVSQTCKLDCSIGFGGNCAECQSLLYCTKCKDGYVPEFSGAACVLNITCNDINCFSCPTNTAECLQCRTGYKIQSNTCVQDICSIANCLSCKTVSTCDKCITNFAPDPTNSETCIAACLALIPNCMVCENDTSCKYCASGFKNVSNACVKACTNKGCDVCATEYTCKTCFSEYYLAGGDCILNCNDFGCATCETTTTCSLCYAGYELSSVKKCVRSCSEGSAKVTGGTCKHCGTYIDKCQSCYPNYDDGYKSVLCNYCSSGYFLNYGVCTQCSSTLSNCLECTSSLVCIRCAKDFRLNGNICQSKDNCRAKNCKTCVSDDPDKCSICNTGFTTNQNGLCKANTCATGMTLISGICVCPSGSYQSSSVSCQKCVDSNCLTCTSVSCSVCRSGYYASGLSCIACVDNCKECVDGSSCTTCIAPYTYQSNKCILKGDGSSVAIDTSGNVFTCQAGCQSCKLGDNNVLVCVTVQSGYALASGVIIKCDSTCKTCRDVPTSCLSCFKGYALNGDECTLCNDPQALTCSEEDATYSLSCSRGYTKVVNTTVVPPTSKCTVCAANCFKCDINGPGKCDAGQCQTGYVQQTGQTTCTLCFNQCPQCSPNDLNLCLDCGKARYENAANLCVSCPSGCKQCSSATVCTDCFPGFFLSNSLCVEGLSWPCVEGSAAFCTKCVANYNSVAGICSYDTTCNGDSSCTSCSLGYYLSPSPIGKCQKCPFIANCLSCSSADTSKCLSCNNGYFAESTGTCTRCSTGCARCTSTKYCSRASAGYYLTANPDGTYNGGTQQCKSPCATCISDPNFCLSCINGYTIDGSSCFSDKQIAYQMIFNYPTIFNSDDSYQVAYGKILLKYLQFRASICQNLPKQITKNDPFCERNFNTKSFSSGSIKMSMNIAANEFSSASAAQSAMDSASLVPSSYLVSKSATVSGFQTQSSSSSTRVSIPLVILVIVIITMMVYSRRELDAQFQGDAYESNKDIGNEQDFYDERAEKYI